MCGPVKLVIRHIYIYIFIYTLTLRTCKKKPRVTSKPGFAMKTWGFEKSRVHQSLPANLWCHFGLSWAIPEPQKGFQNQLKINKPWASSEGPYLWFEGPKSWPKLFKVSCFQIQENSASHLTPRVLCILDMLTWRKAGIRGDIRGKHGKPRVLCANFNYGLVTCKPMVLLYNRLFV